MESLGESLKRAREQKGVELSEAAAATRIKLGQLGDIEKDDYSNVPAPTYAKGFLKIYAQYLGLEPEPIIQRFVDELSAKRPEPPTLKPKKDTRGGLFSRKSREGESQSEEASDSQATESSAPAAEPVVESDSATLEASGEQAESTEVESGPVPVSDVEGEVRSGGAISEPDSIDVPPSSVVEVAPDLADSKVVEKKKLVARLTPDFALSEKEKRQREEDSEESVESARDAAAGPSTVEGPYFGEKPGQSDEQSWRRFLAPGAVAAAGLLLLVGMISHCNSGSPEVVSFEGIDLPENGLIKEPPEPYLKLE